MAPRRQSFLAAALLAGLSALAYWPVTHHDFINLDDDVYVYDNAAVSHGLTAGGVRWAFSTFHAGNWHPLTWLSHMADCQLFGLNAGGHHAVALILHTLNAVLLFLTLRRLTGALGPSVFVAATLAVHPVHVESVAWVAERKDLLCVLWGLLSLNAYARHAQGRGRAWYGISIACFALGLMSKPMLVTFPALLLLLDAWPLGRIGTGPGSTPARRLLIEKIPFAALALASIAITVIAQHRGGAIQSITHLPVGRRLENAAVSGVAYLGKLAYPHALAVFYPYPPRIPATETIGALALLMAVSVLAVRARRSHPYALVGWAWYGIALLPVIGLVQVGNQAMADRYTYLPSIGIAVATAFGAASWARESPVRRRALAGIACFLVAAWVVATRAQVRHWSGSVPLYTHALSVTADNGLMRNNLGVALEDDGRLQEAAEQLSAAVRSWPGYWRAQLNLANVLAALGKPEEAASRYAAALSLSPGSADVLTNYGGLLYAQGRNEEAIAFLERAVAIDPELADAHNNLANALASTGRADEAIQHYREAIRLAPASADLYDNLAGTLMEVGRFAEAETAYGAAIRLAPDRPELRQHLADARARAAAAR